jgi:hypothetical protein
MRIVCSTQPYLFLRRNIGEIFKYEGTKTQENTHLRYRKYFSYQYDEAVSKAFLGGK